MESKRDSGFYSLVIGATSATEKKFVGGQGAELSVKVSTDVVVENTEIAVVDRDQTDMGGNIKKVATFSKLATILEADVHQKVIMKFVVKDKSTNEPTKVHQVSKNQYDAFMFRVQVWILQAFVVFTHDKSGQEIIFIAEADAAKAYKFDVVDKLSHYLWMNQWEKVVFTFEGFTKIGQGFRIFDWKVFDEVNYWWRRC